MIQIPCVRRVVETLLGRPLDNIESEMALALASLGYTAGDVREMIHRQAEDRKAAK